MPVGAGMVPDVDKAQLTALIKDVFQKYGIDTTLPGFQEQDAINSILLVVEVIVKYIQQNAVLVGVTPGAGTVPYGIK